MSGRTWKTTEFRVLQSRIGAGEDPGKVCADIGRTRKQARHIFRYYGISWKELLTRGLRAKQRAAAKLYQETRVRAEVEGHETPHKAALDVVRKKYGLGKEGAHKWLRAAKKPAQRPRAFTRAEAMALVNRFQNGETYAEIADSIGRPRPTVRTTIRRLRSELLLPDTGDLRLKVAG